MILNLKKTNLMLFDPSRTKDFMPEIKVEGTRIDLVEKTKLMGVILTCDLSWPANTDHILKRCNSKAWVLRRLKKLGASHKDLSDVYCRGVHK